VTFDIVDGVPKYKVTKPVVAEEKVEVTEAAE